MNKAQYIVRDSGGEVYLGKHGSLYNNTVTWWRSIFIDGREVDSVRMRRDFDSKVEAQAFSDMLHKQFQGPAFDELTRTSYGNNKEMMEYHDQDYRSYRTGKVVPAGVVEEV